MTNDDIVENQRIRAVLCHAWGIPPWEYDEAWKAGRLTVTNVSLALDVAIINSPNPEITQEFLFPGSQEARKQAELDRQNARAWENVERFLDG